MKKYRNFLYIGILNLCLSLLVVFLSPRFDLITFLGFFLVNVILIFLLINNDKKKDKMINNRIEDIFCLLHSLDTDSSNYEIIDDEFGKLRDEIIKIILENKIITASAERNKETLREYTEDIAHQIKSPLTGALLMIDLIKEDKENHDEYLKRLQNSILRLLNLVDILLKLAALDSNTIEMKKEEVPIKNLLNEISENLEIYFNYDDYKIPILGDDFTLTCDENWTYEAIFNLVKNAIEVSENHKANIYLKETNLYKSIIIEDFSKGLDKKMLNKVFKRFYKSDPQSKGYGIGLPMAKTVIEKQDGDLLYVKGKVSNTFEIRFYK